MMGVMRVVVVSHGGERRAGRLEGQAGLGMPWCEGGIRLCQRWAWPWLGSPRAGGCWKAAPGGRGKLLGGIHSGGLFGDGVDVRRVGDGGLDGAGEAAGTGGRARRREEEVGEGARRRRRVPVLRAGQKAEGPVRRHQAPPREGCRKRRAHERTATRNDNSWNPSLRRRRSSTGAQRPRRVLARPISSSTLSALHASL